MDHSAIKSTVAGKYESKWGAWYVIRHHPDSVPYASSGNRKYYIRKPTITGPSLLCSNSSGTFTITNPPNSYTWACSSNLTAGTPSGKFTANANGQGWVAIKVGSFEVARYNVWVGPPALHVQYEIEARGQPIPPFVFIGPYDILPGDTVRFHSGVQPAKTSVTWTVTPPGIATQCSPNGESEILYAFPINSYTVTATAANSCGSTIGTVSFDVLPRFKLLSITYPNPVNDILTIEIDADDVRSWQPVPANLTFDVRLYNSQGYLLRQTTTQSTTVQFNVSNLPNDIYYLHIYDDVNSPPEIQQIIVQH